MENVARHLLSIPISKFQVRHVMGLCPRASDLFPAEAREEPGVDLESSLRRTFHAMRADMQ